MIGATTTYGVGQVVWTILWFFLLFIEVWLMISIFIDIFRSHDLKGWQKALWVVLVLILPLVGILAYFVARGDKMRAHQEQAKLDEDLRRRVPAPSSRLGWRRRRRCGRPAVTARRAQATASSPTRSSSNSSHV